MSATMLDCSDYKNKPFSNPEPSERLYVEQEDAQLEHHVMTNEDFRKLLMTPRATPVSSVPPAWEEIHNHTAIEDSIQDGGNITDSKAEKRKKRKKLYATLNRQQEGKLAELSKKYKDRAKDRRDGVNPDHQNEDTIASSSGYRAVAHDTKSCMNAAEYRRQMIQESKYLGGDMEHTHLVKGLDYALLQKVRSEIERKEKSEEEMESFLLQNNDKEDETEMHFKSKLAKDIYQTVFKRKPCRANELFLPKHMSYVIDLEDAYTESDMPTTLLRSKVDCLNSEFQTTSSANHIIINKVKDIFASLRLKKGKEKAKGKECSQPKPVDEKIFTDSGDYVPTSNSRNKCKNNTRHTSEQDRKRSYFEKASMEVDEEKLTRKENEKPKKVTETSDRFKQENRLFLGSIQVDDHRLKAKLSSKMKRDMPESYMECYPGAPENEESDDDVDYSKMDMGNKKSAIGRWDFDTQNFSDYMSNKEALPKAAYQYGVKMPDGRKTRCNGKRDEKTKIDRELQQIDQMLARRNISDKFSSLGVGEPNNKRPRY